MRVVFYNEEGSKADEVTRKVILIKAKKPSDAFEKDENHTTVTVKDTAAHKSDKAHKADKADKVDKAEKADKAAENDNGDEIVLDEEVIQEPEQPSKSPAKRSIFWKSGRKRCLGCSRW